MRSEYGRQRFGAVLERLGVVRTTTQPQVTLRRPGRPARTLDDVKIVTAAARVRRLTRLSADERMLRRIAVDGYGGGG